MTLLTKFFSGMFNLVTIFRVVAANTKTKSGRLTPALLAGL